MKRIAQTTTPNDSWPPTPPIPDAGGFFSLLFSGRDAKRLPEASADALHDLNIDQIIDSIASGWTSSSLARHFRTPLTDLSDIAYRQAVMRDVEDTVVWNAIEAFSSAMRGVRDHWAVANNHCYLHEREYWVLESCVAYCEAIHSLQAALASADLASQGLQSFRAFLTSYVDTPGFTAFRSGSNALKSELQAIRYVLRIHGATITVRLYDGEADYSEDIASTFEKFRTGSAKNYLISYPMRDRMHNVEAQIMECLARLLPDLFGRIAAFCSTCGEGEALFIDPNVERFEDDIQFYLAYLSYLEPLLRDGLKFCYPALSRETRHIECEDAFDLALAAKLVSEHQTVVCNSFDLTGDERILVVTGPNQGGKTTFARMFGQAHHLANVGCPVPGSRARLFFFDQVFTLFERHEDVTNLRGKLQDDLTRMFDILHRTTPNTLVLMNEAFSSTSIKDAIFLNRKMLAQMAAQDLIVVCVTFLSELSTFNDKTVSFVSSHSPADPSSRSFRLERKPAEGLAYALALADKHRVTYDWLQRRIAA